MRCLPVPKSVRNPLTEESLQQIIIEWIRRVIVWLVAESLFIGNVFFNL